LKVDLFVGSKPINVQTQNVGMHMLAV